MTETRATPQPATATRPTAIDGAIRISQTGLGDLATLERDWRDLEGRADCSFFLSWSWIGCWLSVLPPQVRPRILRAHHGDELVGVAVVTPCRRFRHGVMRSNGLYLNQTGLPDLDQITIEYNGFLVDRRSGGRIEKAFLDFLIDEADDWDELLLGGVDLAYREIARDTGLRLRLLNRSPCDHVRLDDLRRDGRDYLAALSRNTRYQIRRTRRLYEFAGPLTVEVAADADQALEFFDGMKPLHQAYWEGRGEPGSYSNSFFVRFHRNLIRSRAPFGEIQFLRVKVGDEPIGYLYNLCWRGRVSAYQSGFSYDEDRQFKPGLICHNLAIEHNLAGGAEIYDFLAGDSQYKRSLGIDRTELMWFALQRDRLKYRVEARLRAVKHGLSGLLKNTAAEMSVAEEKMSGGRAGCAV